ncbi:MAG: MGMT family protein [Woeseiaceae bacterium]|nr:MGMT family protein [Woeseiaceae bacterium]
MISESRQQRICDTIRDVPRGSVASYGQIAEIAGIARGARQVGFVLRHLPDGSDVPWHRIVRSDGRIAFDRDSAPFAEQRRRLIMEGVRVTAGRVDMSEFRWRPGLDELLWKPTSAWDES